MKSYTFAPRLGLAVTVEARSESEARTLCMQRVYGPARPQFPNRGLGLLLTGVSGG